MQFEDEFYTEFETLKKYTIDEHYENHNELGNGK